MATLIQPDLGFKRAIIGLDAHDLTACYQCGTCSAVCPISSAENPFPRKEMVWVQWGLKERALGNASIWMCHQCGSCNTYCPRDAKPANVMAALRDYSIGHYAVPAFMGRALNDPKALPLLFGIPAVIFGNVALGKIARSEGQEKGRGMAIAGIALGWVAIAVLGGLAIAWFSYNLSNG